MTKKDINIEYELLVATIKPGKCAGDYDFSDYDFIECYENENKFITFEELMDKVFNACLEEMDKIKDKEAEEDYNKIIFAFSFSKIYTNVLNDKQELQSSLFYGGFACGEPFLCHSEKRARELQSSDIEDLFYYDLDIAKSDIIDYDIAQDISFIWKNNAFKVEQEEMQYLKDLK